MEEEEIAHKVGAMSKKSWEHWTGWKKNVEGGGFDAGVGTEVAIILQDPV